MEARGHPGGGTSRTAGHGDRRRERRRPAHFAEAATSRTSSEVARDRPRSARTMNQTTRPRPLGLGSSPHSSASFVTICRPRPASSLQDARTRRGLLLVPVSWTAVLTQSSAQSTSTTNQHFAGSADPLAVWVTAFVQISLAQSATRSRQGWAVPRHWRRRRRTAPTWSGVPGQTQRSCRLDCAGTAATAIAEILPGSVVFGVPEYDGLCRFRDRESAPL